jgi:hypothetical protein
MGFTGSLSLGNLPLFHSLQVSLCSSPILPLDLRLGSVKRKGKGINKKKREKGEERTRRKKEKIRRKGVVWSLGSLSISPNLTISHSLAQSPCVSQKREQGKERERRRKEKKEEREGETAQ